MEGKKGKSSKNTVSIASLILACGVSANSCVLAKSPVSLSQTIKTQNKYVFDSKKSASNTSLKADAASESSIKEKSSKEKSSKENEEMSNNINTFVEKTNDGAKNMDMYGSKHEDVFMEAKKSPSSDDYYDLLNDDANVRDEEDSMVILESLRVFAKTGDSYSPDELITRAEFIKIVERLLGIEDSAKLFSDLDTFKDTKDSDAKNEINLAVSQGIIDTTEENFRPNDVITTAEALKILVKALGYEQSAKEFGETGYFLVASQLKIYYGGAGLEPGTQLKRRNVAAMCLRAAQAKIMEQTAYGDDKKYEVTDKTFLKDKLKAEFITGKVVETDETALAFDPSRSSGDQEKLPKNKIKIGDEIYLTGETDAKNYLGVLVRCCVKANEQTGEKTIVFVKSYLIKNPAHIINKIKGVEVENTDLSQKITIKYGFSSDHSGSESFDILDSSGNIIGNISNVNSDSSITLDNAESTCIYNGKRVMGLSPNLIKEADDIIIISNDLSYSDHWVVTPDETVFINKYNILVVSYASDKEDKIVGKNGVVLSKDAGYELSLTKDGKDINFDQLKEGDLIWYTVSLDSSLVKAYVKNSVLNGVVQETLDDGSYKFSGENVSFRKSSNYAKDISIGDRGKYYLDARDEIVHFEPIDAPNKNYGFLVASGETSELEPEMQFKIFTKNGQPVTLKAENRIIFNDEIILASDVLKKEQLFENGNSKPQLITYKTNQEGKIVEITTAIANDEPVKDAFSLNAVSENMKFSASSGKLGSARITNETVVFEIPNDALSSDDFKIKNSSFFVDNCEYNARVYDLTPDYKAGAVVIVDSKQNVPITNNICIVGHIAETQNKDLEFIDKLYGIENGKIVQINSDEKGVLVNKGSKLKQGDVIRYAKNENGEIVAVQYLFDMFSKDCEYIDSTLLPDTKLVYGKINDVFDDSMNVSVNGKVENYTINENIIYKYDSSLSGNKVTVSNIQEIKGLEKDKPSRAFILLYKDVVSGVLIVK